MKTEQICRMYTGMSFRTFRACANMIQQDKLYQLVEKAYLIDFDGDKNRADFYAVRDWNAAIAAL